jgi:aminopeptidase N
MWIQEGIATYAEALAYRELAGEEAYHEVLSGHKSRVKNQKPLVQGESVNSVDTYSGDLYFKGSCFMHALRYMLGDTIFFPTLYQLATDSAYTYNNMVTSAEVEQLFSKAAGKNLQPLFDFYLRKTEVLQFSIKNTKYQTYQVQLLNLDMPLPVDITTDKGSQKLMVTKEGITIRSSIPPTLDGKGYYLKKIQFE